MVKQNKQSKALDNANIQLQIKVHHNANIQLVSKSIENNLLIIELNKTDVKDCHCTKQKFLCGNLGIIKFDDGIYEEHRMGVVRKRCP